MKKVLNITKHVDGTYSLIHLTHEQLNTIQAALIQMRNDLKELQEEMRAEGYDLNNVVSYYLTFADEASDQMTELGF